MTNERDEHPGLAMPLLLADALRTYGIAIRRGLIAAGFDDIPRAGAQVIGRIEAGARTAGDAGMTFGASMDAGELVDTLVARGYVDRDPSAGDSGQVTLALTERGVAAAHEIRSAIGKVDAALPDAVSVEDIERSRRVLEALAAG
jgi:hypothetical protein